MTDSDPDVLYAAEDGVALLTLNRPRYKNAQSYRLLDELDAQLERAMQDPEVRVAVVRGAGGDFSSGHDLGTPEQRAILEERGNRGESFYNTFRRYNLDLTLRWHHIPKPTIAMVEGYCIFGGWMIAAAMDLVFAASDARFLAGLVEYFSQPWDLHPRKAKELLFESRFIDGEEACRLGFANRVYAPAELERETLAYARRVAEQDPLLLRLSKLSTNKAWDMQGYGAAIEAAFHDYVVLMQNSAVLADGGVRRLGAVDLAVRGLRGERPGLKKPG